MTAAIELLAGPLRLALRPDLGGAVAGLWRDGLPVLRSTEPADLQRARDAGCYPLVPYSGRLGYRRFRWHGRDHTTAPNFDDSPHSLHGLAWLRPWTVAEQTATRAVLALDHAADADWPFPFHAVQTFELAPDRLTVTLAVTAGGHEPQPVGLGWHPYFPKRSRSRVHAECRGRWDTDPTGLPTRLSPHAGVDGDVAHLAFDHCFEGWQGPARIRDERLSLRLTSSLPRLVVYTPETRPYYCVEPVGHVPNAIHMSDPVAHGLQELAPGARAEATMTLEVQPA
ncbi:MAG: aldose 1-epimerase [Rubrivivax sp.]|jgi:aldose 1-epimerase